MALFWIFFQHSKERLGSKSQVQGLNPSLIILPNFFHNEEREDLSFKT